MANGIDTFARDVAESLSPLPTFSCATEKMTSDAARRRADVKTQVVYSYLHASQVAAKHVDACDHYASYGLKVTVVEPDFKGRVPRITFVDPRRGLLREGPLEPDGALPARGLHQDEGCIVCPVPGPARPPHRGREVRPVRGQGEVVHWLDASQELMFVPPSATTSCCTGRRTAWAKCPWTSLERSGVTEQPRGQYDDVMWLQVARNRFTMLGM